MDQTVDDDFGLVVRNRFVRRWSRGVAHASPVRYAILQEDLDDPLHHAWPHDMYVSTNILSIMDSTPYYNTHHARSFAQQ